MNTKRHEQRIKKVRKRIAKLDKQIDDFILLKSLTTVQRTYKYAERMIDVLSAHQGAQHTRKHYAGGLGSNPGRPGITPRTRRLNPRLPRAAQQSRLTVLLAVGRD